MSPDLVGDVECRVLLNYRVDVERLNAVLPDPFYPVDVEDGVGLGGVCAASLEDARPRFTPRTLGLTVDNTIHRVAVQWKEGDSLRRGSYVVRRDAAGRLKALVESRLMPGDVHPARITMDFDVDSGEYWVRADCDTEFIRFDAVEAGDVDEASVFDSPDEVMEFFAEEEVSYAGEPGSFEVVESCSVDADLQPLEIKKARSSFFENLGGEFDSAVAVVDCQQEIADKSSLKATKS